MFPSTTLLKPITGFRPVNTVSASTQAGKPLIRFGVYPPQLSSKKEETAFDLFRTAASEYFGGWKRRIEDVGRNPQVSKRISQGVAGAGRYLSRQTCVLLPAGLLALGTAFFIPPAAVFFLGPFGAFGLLGFIEGFFSPIPPERLPGTRK
jgi:hypothetical protein